MKNGPESLLVVDDNVMNRDLLARRLERRGYVVTVAKDGPEALKLSDEHAFDLVLLDVEMPGMSGIAVLRVLREKHTPATLPIIMVTARDQSDDIVIALNWGANDYVTKPIDFQVTLARLQTQLARKRAEDSLRESEDGTRWPLAEPTMGFGTGT